MILDIVVFILTLAFLVIAHESGHFLVARLFGMYVEEFAFGFPPRLFSRKKGETRFSVNAIPLGGYVKIPGENGKDFLEEERRANRLEDGHIPENRFFYSKPVWQRMAVLFAGVFMNFIIGWVLLSVVFMVGIPEQVFVGAVSPDSPAYEAGLQQGDELVDYRNSDDFIRTVQEHAGNPFVFAIRRGTQEMEISAIPRENPPQGEGALGIGLESAGTPQLPFFKAIGAGLKESWGLFSMIFILIARLIGSVVSGENLFSQLAGPVGIFQVTSQAANLGIIYLAHLVALISLNLAALNVFPFPALDGGRIVLVLVEKIKGSPVGMKTQAWINGAGFIVLILFLIAVSIQDIRRLF